MFINQSVFSLSVLLGIFQFVLIGFTGALLAIYSRYGGEYANTVRWSRQGGYLEMIKTFHNSRGKIPGQVLFALGCTIFGSILAGVADKGVAKLIQPAVRPSEIFSQVVSTPQFISYQDVHKTLGGWSTSIMYGDDIVQAMAAMVNDTNNIPSAVDGRVYTPHLMDYKIKCNQFNLIFQNITLKDLYLADNGCTSGMLILAPVFTIPDVPDITTTKISKGRWSINISGRSDNSSLEEFTAMPLIVVSDNNCATLDMSKEVSFNALNGLTSLPRTTITKCVVPNGDIAVVSMTAARFMTISVQNFHSVSTSVFERDEMLQAMEFALASSPFVVNSNLFMEIKANGSSIDVLACANTKFPVLGVMPLSCIFINLNAIVLQRQEINPLIIQTRKGRPLSDSYPLTTMMTITHFPNTIHGVEAPISLSRLRNSSAAATRYMASLGHNLLMDWPESRLYVLYDYTDSERGWDAPTWLIILMLVITVVCALFWGIVEGFLDVVYTGSVYKIISTILSPHLGLDAPMLMRSTAAFVTFEHIPVVPEDGDMYQMDANMPRLPVPETIDLPPRISESNLSPIMLAHILTDFTATRDQYDNAHDTIVTDDTIDHLASVAADHPSAPLPGTSPTATPRTP
ncbi:hypothetical protein EDD11_005515 [Mortierella claussenii]|nr:hypothetical protein EDD11_005515 [Mortierella claussenii]